MLVGGELLVVDFTDREHADALCTTALRSFEGLAHEEALQCGSRQGDPTPEDVRGAGRVEAVQQNSAEKLKVWEQRLAMLLVAVGAP